jgi:CheY-like chemotaxis protein
MHDINTMKMSEVTVLLVDDEPVYRTHLAQALERQGLVTWVAANADEARKYVVRSDPDIAIVDIELRSSLNGLQFAEWLRHRGRETALIVTTGYGSPDYQRQSQQLGAVAYLEKPFELPLLKSHIDHVRERKGLVREIHRLEQHLRRTAEHLDALSRFPVARIAESGDVLFASPSGLEILSSLAEPGTVRPVARLDEPLMARLWEAAGRPGPACTTVYRRDETLGHYRAVVAADEKAEGRSISVFFGDTPSGADEFDPLWIPLLFRAMKGS